MKKENYLQPSCRILGMDIELFLCSTVTTSPSTSEEDWGEDKEIEGGELEI